MVAAKDRRQGAVRGYGRRHLGKQRQQRTDQATDAFLRRLRRDVRGNALAMMAISIIPITAMVGSGMDLARTYMVQSRLQQACDAGVLAGRRAMTTVTMTAADKTQANDFFNFNFPTGMFENVTRTFTPSDGELGTVAGTATANVKMTLMRMMFKQEAVDLVVNCESKLDISNTDVMFVLDTTGSMACSASDSTSACNSYVDSVKYSQNGNGYWLAAEKSDSRIAALRTAVLGFYDSLSSSAGETTRLRFGFVPYSTTVNVGALIPSQHMVANASYQSRVVSEWYKQTTAVYNGTNCNSYDRARTPAAGYDSNGRATFVNGTASVTSGRATCTVDTYTLRAAKTSEPPNPLWRYDQIPYDVSPLRTGGTIPDRTDVTTPTIAWSKCIEEAKTSPNTSFPPLTPDLDVDLVPNSEDTRWRPYLPDLIYNRANTNSELQTGNYGQPTFGLGSASCPKPSQALQEMTRTQVSDYTSASKGFVAHGGTYHDIGMIWGGRLLSADGIMKASNVSPNGQDVNRNIVFITDGDMAPRSQTYSAYGYEKLDERVMGSGSKSDDEMRIRHNARFNAVCEAVKDKNITVWVIAYAQAMTTQLQDCATDEAHAIFAPDDATLKAKLAEIATKIAALRLYR